MLYPLKLEAPLKDYLWGGHKLVDKYGKKSEMPIVAESWELSCHKDGQSVIANGPSAGMTLADYIEQEGRDILGTRAAAGTGFPILIKFIDAKGNLSVQVHPDDDYAQRVEGEPGKTEMWYVMEAEPGAKLIYGFDKEISREEFVRRIDDNTLLEVCRQVPVHKGDVFFIESGTLHAVGEGILICEIQQSSNTTYRVYDYGRKGADGKTRELHVKKALDVTHLVPLPLETKPQASIMHLLGDVDVALLASCEYFTVYHFDLHTQDRSVNMAAPDVSFQALTVLSGSLELKSANGKLELKMGETAFLPVGLGAYTLDGTAEFLLSEK